MAKAGKIQHWKHGWIPLTPEAKAYVAGGWKGDRPGQGSSDPLRGVKFFSFPGDAWTTTPEQQRELGGYVQDVRAKVPGMGDIKVTHDTSSDFMATGRTAGFAMSDMMYDEKIVSGYRRDWDGVSLAGSTKTNADFRRVTVAHELGHTLMHRVENASPEGRKAVNDFLDEPITPRSVGFDTGDIDRVGPRWKIDTLDRKTVYANESRYEFWAESLADGIINGERASESGKRALALARKYLGET